MNRAWSALPFSLLFSLSSAPANDANWSTFGGAGAFTPNPYVRMEREDVRITLLDDEVRVHATFWFRNRGAARTVQIGFPHETANWKETERGSIRAFRTSVDGRPVPAIYRPLRSDSETFRSAWVKTVPFARDGARKVEVWYTADHGYAGDGWAFDTYVFRTGATWRGTIGRMEATVDWSKMRKRSRPLLRLTGPAPGARWERLGFRRERLTVENVKPKFDLDLTTIEGFWHFRLNGRRIEQNLGLPVEGVGPVVRGTPEDLRVAAEGLGRIFGRYLEDKTGNTDWAARESRLFGGTLSLEGKQTLVTGDGRRLRLARPATDEMGRPLTGDRSAYIRLRDVIRALGGSYTYVGSRERVDLRLGRPSNE